MGTNYFNYRLRTEIIFGCGRINELNTICKQNNWERGVLVCDPIFMNTGLAEKVMTAAGGALVDVFSDLQPNPSVQSVDKCAVLLRKHKAQVIVALGGGSSLDCAKAASVTAYSEKSVRAFHSGGEKIKQEGIPLIAVPTTAGTGSEVTNVAVLTDEEKGIKAPLASDYMFAHTAIVDPELTLTVPKQVVASTGLDALSHALEGYWSKNHQPICDAYAIYAAKLVFDFLYAAYLHGDDISVKEKMSEAALIAGLAFGPPKTAGVHACSFPLTRLYKLPHGEACAFSLDAFVRLNSEVEKDRMQMFANMVGFKTTDEMADRILELKKATGMRCTLSEAKIKTSDVPELAEQCKHPNLLNNPRQMSTDDLIDMFMSMN
jgi:alcohol dehydrogenase class IV